MEMDGFLDCVQQSWQTPSRKGHISAIITDKFKQLRKALKRWQTSLSKLKTLINKCNQVVLCLDDLEELRPIFRREANFRLIVKLHLDHLLHLQFLYWKKRATIRFIKVGEENTKKIHAMATERYRRNSISSLRLVDGSTITDHEKIAGCFWSSFKNRMGSSQGINLAFDLQSLIPRVDGLDVLTLPFTHKEMDRNIKEMPVDKAPGPDGFNGLFFQEMLAYH